MRNIGGNYIINIKEIVMETNFNFNSQICTSREQSERLLALGLKKETADMYLCPSIDGIIYQVVQLPESSFAEDETPSWSLGRLMEMLPNPIPISEDLPTFNHYAFLNLSAESVVYCWEDYDGADRALVGFTGNGFFAAVVDATEWLIKEGYFNKEYLEE